jgi:hypothetical protein
LNIPHPTATVAVSWSTAFHFIIPHIHLSGRGQGVYHSHWNSQGRHY